MGITRLEAQHGIGADADGACGYCRGRERELGKVVIRDDPPGYEPLCRWDRHENAGPTPCPRCGRDMNITIVVRRINLMAKRRVDAKMLALSRSE